MRATLCKLNGCDRKRHGLLRLCYLHFRERAKKIKEEKNAKRLARKLRSKKYQQSETKKWHAKCWKLMSEWVRRKDADWRGYNSCYTCGVQLHYKLCHASHFFHGTLDFDERNLKNCCVQCNLYLSGNLAHYAIRLAQENGLEWMDKLRHDAGTHGGYNLDDLKRIHAELIEKLKSL